MTAKKAEQALRVYKRRADLHKIQRVADLIQRSYGALGGAIDVILSSDDPTLRREGDRVATAWKSLRALADRHMEAAADVGVEVCRYHYLDHDEPWSYAVSYQQRNDWVLEDPEKY